MPDRRDGRLERQVNLQEGTGFSKWVSIALGSEFEVSCDRPPNEDLTSYHFSRSGSRCCRWRRPGKTEAARKTGKGHRDRPGYGDSSRGESGFSRYTELSNRSRNTP
jgi:hypothetical protein